MSVQFYRINQVLRRSDSLRKIKALGFLILTASLMSACGKNGSFVSGVNVLLQEKEGEEWVGISTTLNTGKATLPTMSIPIYDKKRERVLIEVQLSNTGGAKPKSVIGFTTNLSKLDDLPQCEGSPSLLPNGSPIPLVDTSKKIYCVPIGQQTGRIYIGAHADMKELGVGIALTIKEFQAIGKKVGKMDLFLPFEFQNIGGVYGFFTSKEANQNGLGLFFDLSRYINPEPTAPGEEIKSLLTSKDLEATTPKEQTLLKGMMKIQEEEKVLGLH